MRYEVHSRLKSMSLGSLLRRNIWLTSDYISRPPFLSYLPGCESKKSSDATRDCRILNTTKDMLRPGYMCRCKIATLLRALLQCLEFVNPVKLSLAGRSYRKRANYCSSLFRFRLLLDSCIFCIIISSRCMRVRRRAFQVLVV